jgi:hypothetical protein
MEEGIGQNQLALVIYLHPGHGYFLLPQDLYCGRRMDKL